MWEKLGRRKFCERLRKYSHSATATANTISLGPQSRASVFMLFARGLERDFHRAPCTFPTLASALERILESTISLVFTGVLSSPLSVKNLTVSSRMDMSPPFWGHARTTSK